eukprot:6490434-Prymnesium_polylepis.1
MEACTDHWEQVFNVHERERSGESESGRVATDALVKCVLREACLSFYSCMSSETWDLHFAR